MTSDSNHIISSSSPHPSFSPLPISLSPSSKSMALFLSSQPLPTSLPTLSAKTHFACKPQSVLLLSRRQPISPFLARSEGNGATVAVEEKVEESTAADAKSVAPQDKESLASNGAVAVSKFADKKWVNGTWDLAQFKKGMETDWDAVIEAEARRRKWLEDNPESSNNEDAVVFDTSIIPWWAWIKRYHLPEAEVLNGRAAMIGFFMAYFVDSLTGVGLVDQMGNFFCKTLLLIAVLGVLLVRKNEDIEKLKKLIEETTFYDKQWQATWQDGNTKDASKE